LSLPVPLLFSSASTKDPSFRPKLLTVVSSAAEKSASLPQLLPSHHRSFAFAVASSCCHPERSEGSRRVPPTKTVQTLSTHTLPPLQLFVPTKQIVLYYVTDNLNVRHVVEEIAFALAVVSELA
jgi:hypothetical protein